MRHRLHQALTGLALVVLAFAFLVLGTIFLYLGIGLAIWIIEALGLGL